MPMNISMNMPMNMPISLSNSMRSFLRSPQFALRKFAPIGLALLIVPLAANAQQPPVDAGMLQQQIERERITPMPTPLPPERRERVPAQAKPGAITVSVARFEFDGNTLLSETRLQAAVSRFLNRPITFDELQAVAAAVAEVYREAGWVVRAFVPQQEIDENQGNVIIRIQILEALFGEVKVDLDDKTETSAVNVERLKAMMFAAQAKGQPINTRNVDRGLLLLEDLPGVQVQGRLTVGKQDRETDMDITVINQPPLSGDLRLDNTGSRSTGRIRLNGSLSWANPNGEGDLAGLNLLHTEGSDYGRISYRYPLGYSGLSLEGNGSLMQYRVISADAAALDANGASRTLGLDLGYPILRSRQANLATSLALEYKDYDNEANGTTTTRYDIMTLGLSLRGNHSDSWLGGGNFSAMATLSTGDVDLSGSPNAEADAQTTQSAGRFAKLRYTLSRNQRLSETWSAQLSWNGQFANKNLDSAEKLYLGGSSGVRAYPSSEGGGSEGQQLNLDVTGRLPHGFSLTLFYDWGRVRVNTDNDFPGAPPLNTFSLHGAGTTLAWSNQKNLDARLTWSRRIGSNPNATATGMDGDGTLINNRLWASLSYLF
jgi:hemolysin activation/secretion protein